MFCGDVNIYKLWGIKQNIIFTQIGINCFLALCIFAREERILELEELLKVK